MPPMGYTNRKGVEYYVHRVVDQRGAARYTFRKSRENAVAQLPAEYEIVENVNGLASIRRIRKAELTDDELSLVRSFLKGKRLSRHRAEAKGRHLVVYEPDADPADLLSVLDSFTILPGLSIEALLRQELGDAAVDEYRRQKADETRQFLEKTMHFSPVLRFTLCDRKSRLFCAEVYSWRGAGAWIECERLPLRAAAKKYIPRIGTDALHER